MGTSIKTRFLLMALAVTMLSLPVALYTENRVRALTEESRQLINEGRELGWVSDSLEYSLRATENAIYQYPLLQDEASHRNILMRLAETKAQAEHLVKHEALSRNLNVRDYAVNLQVAIDLLAIEVQRLLSVLSDVKSRFPAMAIFFNDLRPGNQAFVRAVNVAIYDARGAMDEPDQLIILSKLQELRYAWAQQISAVRVHVTNPFGGLASTAEMNELVGPGTYIGRVDELMAELDEYRKLGKLHVRQREALSTLREVRVQYELDLERAVRINNSPEWRADLPILQNDIAPILEQAGGILDLMKQEMSDRAKQNIAQAMDTMGTLSTIIWLFNGVMALILVLAYFMFERGIRRPILEVTHALEAHGKGKDVLPELIPSTPETAVLVEALVRMQGQVQSRQTRLASILDSAAEGIITVDVEGTIETFSNAAQQLFGYSSDDVLGRPVMAIIPLSPGGVFATFMELCKSPTMSISGYETTVTAHRRDGSSFPMEVKVNKLEVEGRTLYVALVADISERMEMLEKLRKMAEHDSLTGIYNREYFLNEVGRVVENAKRGSPREFALLYIDLDNFKFVNDTLGHLAGDRVLMEVTEMLSKRNRKSDLLARLGGDEFALLLYDAHKDQVLQAAEAHRQLLADYVFKYQGKVIQIGCSIGITLFGRSVNSKEELLMQADIACHIAKRSGRNCVHLYEPDDEQDMTAMSEDMGWARRIKEAIEHDQFCLVSQPIMSLKSEGSNKHEVLLRMRNEDGNLMQTASFISAAERFGLMRQVDRWVIQHAIEALGKQLKAQPNLHYAINLSAESIGKISMLQVITDALETYGVPPASISFEITETVAIANLGVAQKFLEKLRELGCQTALDDFGVGYSSFAYLKDLPVDCVKIDGSFVRDIQHDEVQRAMVRAMNEIAHAMGKTTIAECVDSDGCVATLRKIGVDYAQGFHLGRPAVINSEPDVPRKAPVIRLRK